MCNIPIYFYNIRMKHLQHTSETFEIFETASSLAPRLANGSAPGKASNRAPPRL
jgi:hypothetical protein